MPRAKLDVDEIDDEAEADAVGDVAGNSGEQQGQGTEDAVVGAGCSPKEIDNKRTGDHRHY